MKKLMIILFVFALLFGSANVAKAQVENGYVSFTALSTTDTQTTYLVIASPVIISKDYAVTLTVKPSNTSGTATVTATAQGSTDNSTWYDLETAVTVNNAGTVALKGFVYPHAYYGYYRVKLVSSGTGVTAFTGKFGLKKPNL